MTGIEKLNPAVLPRYSNCLSAQPEMSGQTQNRKSEHSTASETPQLHDARINILFLGPLIVLSS